MRYHDYPRSVNKPILNGQLAPVGWGGVDQYDFRWGSGVQSPIIYTHLFSHLNIIISLNKTIGSLLRKSGNLEDIS